VTDGTLQLSIRRAATALAALALLLLSAPAVAETARGPARAIEGDLLDVGGQRVRLAAIDAPDRGQRCRNRRNVDYDCFEVSRNALERLTKGRIVTCILNKPPPTPKLGVCKLDDGRDVAGVMAYAGWALAFRRLDDRYVGLEALAVTARRGLWGGRVEAPWIWRTRELERKQLEKKDP
jgi:endonuclease YncB( thermonuclease family)